MSTLGRPVSLNDEPVPTPKMRKDQQRRIKQIVKDNSKNPVVALGLVRDYTKSLESLQEVCSVTFDDNESPSRIEVHMRSKQSGLFATYEFTLFSTLILSVPTL